MSQYRYFDYLSEIRSKKSSEGIAVPIGIGAVFGYNEIYYDGSVLLVSADPSKNYKHNLTNERSVLINPYSSCITPDGIMAVETSGVEIPLDLGTFEGTKEIAIIATHPYEKLEGGTNTTYRAYINTTSTNWFSTLNVVGATMETWLELLAPTLRRESEVVIGMCSIQKVGAEYQVSRVINPYQYVWGINNYVTYDRYNKDINELKQLIPQFEQNTITLSNAAIALTTREFTNSTPTNLNQNAFDLNAFVFSKLGDVLEVALPIKFDFSGSAIDLSKQILLSMDADMNYTSTADIDIMFTRPIDFSWLKANTEDPVTGQRIQQNTHMMDGEVMLKKNKFTLRFTLYPIKGNIGNVAADLSLKSEFTARMHAVARVIELNEVTLSQKSQEGTTGIGKIFGEGRFLKGSSVTISAEPQIGSGWVGWYTPEGVEVSKEKNYTFILENDVNYVAVFNGSSVKANISVNTDPAGKANVTGTGEYYLGMECTLQCTPATEYSFDYWSMDGTTYRENPLTFTVSKTTNILCKLVAPKRTVNLFSNPAGIMSLTGAGSYRIGESVTIKAVVLNSTYGFKGWYRDSISSSNLVSTNPEFSFVMGENNMNLYAYAESLVGTIQLTTENQPSSANYGNVTGAGSYPIGQRVMVGASNNNPLLGMFVYWENLDTGEKITDQFFYITVQKGTIRYKAVFHRCNSLTVNNNYTNTNYPAEPRGAFVVQYMLLIEGKEIFHDIVYDASQSPIAGQPVAYGETVWAPIPYSVKTIRLRLVWNSGVPIDASRLYQTNGSWLSFARIGVDGKGNNDWRITSSAIDNEISGSTSLVYSPQPQ